MRKQSLRPGCESPANGVFQGADQNRTGVSAVTPDSVVRSPTVFLRDPDVTLYHGDVLETLRAMPDETVDCVVTSPPYWGLRCYGVDGQLGLEPTPDLFVARMVEVFREVRRVLAPHGTCWVNLGSSYFSVSAHTGGCNPGNESPASASHSQGTDASGTAWLNYTVRLKPKDMVPIPWMVAMALQADGWYLRADIIWAKPNPMPESVTDRPTKAHEFVFLLTKAPRYWFDQEAVREPHNPKWQAAYERHPKNPLAANPDSPVRTHSNGSTGGGMGYPEAGRNIRSVWEIATQPYPEAHFATYPEELVRRCLLAGCPEWVCADCGRPLTAVESGDGSTTKDVPRVRGNVHESERSVLLQEVLEHRNGASANVDARVRDDEGLQAAVSTGTPDVESSGLRDGTSPSNGRALGSDADSERGGPSSERGTDGQPDREPSADGEAATRSFEEAAAEADPLSTLRGARSSASTCSEACSGRRTPGVVLDPFCGSGTTAHVARKHGRHAIGLDLNADYLKLAARRLQQLSLFALEDPAA